MLTTFEVFPLFLNVSVAFKFNIAFGEFVAVSNVRGNEVAEQKCIYAFALVFGSDCHEEQVNNIAFAAYSLP